MVSLRSARVIKRAEMIWIDRAHVHRAHVSQEIMLRLASLNIMMLWMTKKQLNVPGFIQRHNLTIDSDAINNEWFHYFNTLTHPCKRISADNRHWCTFSCSFVLLWYDRVSAMNSLNAKKKKKWIMISAQLKWNKRVEDAPFFFSFFFKRQTFLLWLLFCQAKYNKISL